MRTELLARYFRHRSSFLLLLAAPVVVFSLQGHAVGPLATGVGLLLLASGVVLRVLAVRRIGRGARVFRAHASAGLICGGPYAWTRNPLYIAAGSMLAGLAALAGGGALWSALMFAAAILVYTPVVVHEEEALRELLGPAYRDYAAATPRWLGIPRRFAAPAQPDLASWRELLRRERFLLPGSVAAALGVLVLRGDGLPVAAWLDWASRHLGVEPSTLVAGGFVAGAVWNSWKIERKRRRRAPRPMGSDDVLPADQAATSVRPQH